MPAPIACDPDNPREEDLEYANSQKSKVWSWLGKRFIDLGDKGRDNERERFSLGDVKKCFPLQGIELLEMQMKCLITDGKVVLSSAVRSRVKEYSLTVIAVEEFNTLQVQKIEDEEMEREIAMNQAKLKNMAEEQARARKQPMKEEKQGVARDKKFKTTAASIGDMGEKRSFESLNKENVATSHHHTRGDNSAADSPQNARFKKSKHTDANVDTEPMGMVSPTSMGTSNIRTIVLERSPNLDCMKSSSHQAPPLEAATMETITEIILVMGGEGDGIKLQSVYEAAASSGVTLDDFYAALEHLSEMNRIMVDWCEAAKEQSTIYQL